MGVRYGARMNSDGKREALVSAFQGIHGFPIWQIFERSIYLTLRQFTYFLIALKAHFFID